MHRARKKCGQNWFNQSIEIRYRERNIFSIMFEVLSSAVNGEMNGGKKGSAREERFGILFVRDRLLRKWGIRKTREPSLPYCSKVFFVNYTRHLFSFLNERAIEPAIFRT